ncbi:EAL domain-containing protein [Pseudaminobacter sp. 19-2017]|uniref:EAL domain-containing protein n=1 Tax=Pseudaminobacter soli (ex Zhang et al. 2022) TaxID=2831468 RepID=A0A942IAW0_9HYPH|nr:EAL domain-containing protein [Pseudaminobacter soli]MBS3650931.1 EAL domain-containing protein [Pseudaminobacter soli]
MTENPTTEYLHAIVQDEIGLSFGLLPPLRLKTAFQPVFVRRNTSLVPVAVSFGVAFQERGRAVYSDALLDLPAEQTAAAEWIGPRLAIRNLDFIGCDDPYFDLIIELPAGVEQPCAEIEALIEEALSVGIMPERLYFDLSSIAEAKDLAEAAEALGRSGASLALELEATSRLNEMNTSFSPALVRVPSKWTQGIVTQPELMRVFRLLVTTLRSRGIMIQVEGISDAAQLRAALAANADRLQGDHLEPGALAGTEFDDSPRLLATLMGAHGNVVPLTA